MIKIFQVLYSFINTLRELYQFIFQMINRQINIDTLHKENIAYLWVLLYQCAKRKDDS